MHHSSVQLASFLMIRSANRLRLARNSALIKCKVQPASEYSPAKRKADNLYSWGNGFGHVSVVGVDVMTTDVVNTIVASDERNVNNLEKNFRDCLAGAVN
jgi:hypothetical protein